LHGEAATLILASTLKHFGFVLRRERLMLGKFLQAGIFGQEECWRATAERKERLLQGGGIEH